MDRVTMENYRQKLNKEKKRILNTLDKMEGNGVSLSQREEIDELSMLDNHPADLGTEMFDKERNYALLDNEKTILSQIDKAIERIEKGTYGKCELCGKNIDEDRLKFLPYALTCIECEEKKPDYNTYRYDRPVEEETLAPFGRYFMDNNDEVEQEVGFNAEDSWQDVEKYNVRDGIERNFDETDDEEKSYGEAENDAGIVDPMDRISNQQYKAQLP